MFIQKLFIKVCHNNKPFAVVASASGELEEFPFLKSFFIIFFFILQNNFQGKIDKKLNWIETNDLVLSTA